MDIKLNLFKFDICEYVFKFFLLFKKTVIFLSRRAKIKIKLQKFQFQFQLYFGTYGSGYDTTIRCISGFV